MSDDPIRDRLADLPTFSVGVPGGFVGILRARITDEPEPVDRWVLDHGGRIEETTTDTGNRLKAGRTFAEPPRHGELTRG